MAVSFGALFSRRSLYLPGAASGNLLTHFLHIHPAMALIPKIIHTANHAHLTNPRKEGVTSRATSGQRLL